MKIREVSLILQPGFRTTLRKVHPLKVELSPKMVFQWDGRAVREQRKRWFQGKKEGLLVLFVS